MEFLATHIRNLRGAQPNTVVVHAGDLIGASPLLGAAFNDEPSVIAMNNLGLDIASVGNHEFDKGAAELTRIANGGESMSVTLEREHEHGHAGRGHGIAVGWLLVLPLIAVNVISPQALGLDAVGRLSSATRGSSSSTIAALPAATDGAVALPMWDFVTRANDRHTTTLEGVRIRLVGFVARPRKGSPAPAALARFSITCCAADGFVSTAGLHGQVGGLPLGQWVEVIGTWRTVNDPEVRTTTEPELDVQSVLAIREPTDPYE